MTSYYMVGFSKAANAGPNLLVFRNKKVFKSIIFFSVISA